MNNLDELFIRADIQQIPEFLLHGVAENHLDPRPYKERIASAHKAFTIRLIGTTPTKRTLKRPLRSFMTMQLQSK